MKKLISILYVVIICQLLVAQTGSETLLLIDDQAIQSDEFLRIYNKNSSITLEEKKSVEEYMDLFINYKLKVIEAQNLGYDTISSFIKEMGGYTKQLAKPYLDKSSLIDSFILEAYSHYVNELNASHILLKLDKSALPRDTARVYNRLMDIRQEIIDGKDWDKAIDDNSRNPKDKIGGDLGWFGGFRMVHPFEAAAYDLEVGEVSMPVRTMFGYHLIKLNERRKNRGEVNARHIMTIIPRKPSDAEVAAARQKIEKAYEALLQGAEWDSIARAYSEHKTTYFMGGKLGWIKSGNAPDALLDTCFTLKIGEYSGILRSEYGFHIGLVDKIKPLLPFEDVEDQISKKIRQSGAITKITNVQRLERIKDEYGYKLYEENIDALYELIDSSLFTGKWDSEVAKDLKDTIFFIGDTVITQYDAAVDFSRRPVVYRRSPLEVIVRKRIQKQSDKVVLNYELAKLPSKYPEYKYLLDEYHDGILLFNLTEDKVWRKAVEDSTGLEAFYEGLPEKHKWEDRISISKYVFADSLISNTLLKVAKKRLKKGLSVGDISLQVCGQDTLPCIQIEELKFEKGDNALADGMKWKKGSYLLSKDKENHILYFVEAVIPSQIKELNDARGLYTADYQTYLEKEWVADLRDKYSIQVINEVLNKIIIQESEK